MDNINSQKDAVGENLLSVHDITREIDAGTAFTRFVLKRFSSRFCVEMVNGRPWYAKKDLPVMLWIKQELESGRLPGEIEKILASGPDLFKDPAKDSSDPEALFLEQPGEDIPIGKEGLHLIRSLFNNLEDHQKKIALAQEKRAATEERKAAALDNIAAALQQMIRQGGQDHAVQMKTQETVRTIQGKDDLTQLLDIPLPCSKDLDDLADLIDSASSGQPDKKDLDDLTRLVDVPRKNDTANDLDDLGVLITAGPENDASVDLDDLSLLVQPSKTDDLDDLSRLIPDENEPGEPRTHTGPADQNAASLDDLATLVNTKEPSLKPGISRDQDLEKYKAAVMKIIMSLKTRGVGAEETARRLNQDKVKTISGKPDWTAKAIFQIYSFIDAAS